MFLKNFAEAEEVLHATPCGNTPVVSPREGGGRVSPLDGNYFRDFPISDNLSLEKLAKLEMKHLARMNVTDFGDQKLIIKQIRGILNNVRNNPGGDILDGCTNIISNTPRLIPLDPTSLSPEGNRLYSKSLDIFPSPKKPTLDEKVSRKMSNDSVDPTVKRERKTRRSYGAPTGNSSGELLQSGSTRSLRGSFTGSPNKAQSRKGSRKSFDKELEKIMLLQNQLDPSIKNAGIADLKKQVFNLKDNGAGCGSNLNFHEKLADETMANAKKHEETKKKQLVLNASRRRSVASGNIGNGAMTTKSADLKESSEKRERLLTYGNSAQRSQKADDQLKNIGKKVLKSFQTAIKAERSTLMFVDDEHRQIFFWLDNTTVIRFPKNHGIAGYSATTSDLVNIPDAYEDSRFNKKIDADSGFHTRNILCAPIKSKEGGGVVAVIQMLNKKDGMAFDENDEEMILNCCMSVSISLDTQMQTMKAARNDLKTMHVSEPNAAPKAGAKASPAKA